VQLKDVNDKLHKFSAGLTNMWDFWDTYTFSSPVLKSVNCRDSRMEKVGGEERNY